MKISICIPTYNRAKNLELCLTALTKQTFPQSEWEIVIGNDGSTDNTVNVINRFNTNNLFKNPIKYVYCGEHNGYKQCRARNMAVEIADQSTKAYLFLDSDILLNPNVLELFNEAYDKNPNRVILGMYFWGKPIKMIKEDVLNNWDAIMQETLPVYTPKGQHGMEGEDIRANSFNKTEPDELHFKYGDYLACFGGLCLVPKHIFNQTGGYWEELKSPTEDGAFGLELQQLKVPISYHKHIKGYHVFHTRNIPEIQKVSAEDVKKIDARFGINVHYEDREEFNKEIHGT